MTNLNTTPVLYVNNAVDFYLLPDISWSSSCSPTKVFKVEMVKTRVVSVTLQAVHGCVLFEFQDTSTSRMEHTPTSIAEIITGDDYINIEFSWQLYLQTVRENAYRPLIHVKKLRVWRIYKN